MKLLLLQNTFEKNLSNNLRFDKLRKILESYEYVMTEPRDESKHYTFRKRGCQPFTIPKHKPIKKAYVELVKQNNTIYTK